MKKSNKGFTLVELIVVIAIIGILAAILVPAMIGYIADSKLSSANSSAKTVYTAAMAGCQKLVNKGTPINSTATGYTLNLANAGKDEAPTTADYNSSVTTAGAPKSAEDFLQKAVCSSLNVDAANSVARVLIGDKGFPVEVCWAKNGNDKYVGAYPNAKEKADGVISTYSWTVSISAAPAASSSSSEGE